MVSLSRQSGQDSTPDPRPLQLRSRPGWIFTALCHWLSPLYQYRHNLVKDETEFDALFLYRHLTTPVQTADRLLPFWDYAGATTKADWRVSLLGIESMALYRHDTNEIRTLDHLFPFYG